MEIVKQINTCSLWRASRSGFKPLMENEVRLEYKSSKCCCEDEAGLGPHCPVSAGAPSYLREVLACSPVTGGCGVPTLCAARDVQHAGDLQRCLSPAKVP